MDTLFILVILWIVALIFIYKTVVFLYQLLKQLFSNKALRFLGKVIAVERRGWFIYRVTITQARRITSHYWVTSDTSYIFFGKYSSIPALQSWQSITIRTYPLLFTNINFKETLQLKNPST